MSIVTRVQAPEPTYESGTQRYVCVCDPRARKQQTGDLGVCWPASLPNMASSRISERCYLQRKRQKRGGQRRMTSGFHTQMHTCACMPYGWTCTHIHTYAHIHVYTHTHTCVYTHTCTHKLGGKREAIGVARWGWGPCRHHRQHMEGLFGLWKEPYRPGSPEWSP